MFLRSRWFVLSVVALALALTSLSLQRNAAKPLQLDESVSEFQQHSAWFEVLENPRKAHQRFSAVVRLKQIDLGSSAVGLAARGTVSGDVEFGEVHRGSIYSCQLQFRPALQPSRDGFSGYCRDEPKLVQIAPAYLDGFTALRENFLGNLSGVSPDAAGLVAGLAIGDTSAISEQVLADMKLVSLTHLTAVSGANCAIVVALVYFLLKRFGARRTSRTLAALVALVGYVLLVGAQPSVLRSAVMAGAVLIGSGAGRRTSPVSALALAVLVLLIADPWLSIDFGFALSVLATLGLLLLTSPMTEWLSAHLPSWMALSIAVAVAAQLFCLPVLLQLQGGLASYSLAANLLAEPLVAPITVLGILGCLLAYPLPWLAGALSWLASVAAWCITRIAHGFASLPKPTIEWFSGVAGVLVAITLIVAVLVFFKSRGAGIRQLAALAIALVVAISFSITGSRYVRSLSWPMHNWQIVNCDVGQGDALVIRSANRIALVDVGRDDAPIDACLDRLSVESIDLLMLTHFDMDHVGGLSGAIAGRKIGTAIVSSFPDERWGALGALKLLRDSGVPINSASSGFTGKLGDIDFELLNPAGSPEDSNDGSIAAIWRGPEFNLITLADLGERGQMRLAASLSTWWGRGSQLPLVLKVSHHGSADQYAELIETIHPQLSLISVGKGNSYGHPTGRTLNLLNRIGSQILRTDELGAISVGSTAHGLGFATSGAG